MHLLERLVHVGTLKFGVLIKKKKEKVDRWVKSEPELERKVREDFRNRNISI